ncbi:MAG: hypothetical protein Q9P44_00475 [Anaerolineae bacterium]|nr:hypothetical protein [Anaerolineae bacterium]
MRDRTMQQRITVVLGVVLVFAMLSSTAIGLLRNLGQRGSSNSHAQAATSVAPPTVPPPISNLESIDFSETYLHPSGLFTAALPSGWQVTNETSTTGEAQVTMRNSTQLSVVEIRVTRPTSEQDISTIEGVSAIFDDSWLTSSWREYSTWDESARTIEDGRVVIDFNLSRSGQTYIGRQESFTDGTWVYSVRAVTPGNASQMLQYVLDNEVNRFQMLEQYVGAPLEWNAYFDGTSNYIIRYPSTWAVVDSAQGAPVSINGANAQLRVEALEATVDSEEAASAYTEGLRGGINVLSVEPVEQFDASGFNVAYTLSTLDGATQSGLVTILNDDEGSYAANLLLTDISDTDLNTVDIEAEDTPQTVSEAIALLGTFSLNPDMNLVAAE